MAGAVLGIVSGFLLGIIGSYLAWLWTVRAYVPKLSVSSIARSTVSEQPPKYKYRIKVLNRGRHSVSDISISSRVFIPGLNPERPTNLTSLHIPVADERPFPVLEGRKGRIYTLRVSEASGGGIERLPQEVRKRVDDRQISLEELLDLGSGSYLRLAVAGSHEIGGLRRTISRRYNAQDIVDGGFVALTSIEIGRTESTPPDEVPSSEIDIKPDTTEVLTGFSEEEEELDEE